MRIISKFKDYYDGVQALGQDSSLVYNRKTEEVGTPTESEIDKFLDELANFQNVKHIRSSGEDLYICKVILGFCGQLLTCYCAQWPTVDLLNSPVFFYSREELINYLDKHKKTLVLEDVKFRSNMSWKKKESVPWQEFIPTFEPIRHNYDGIFHLLKKPIFIFPSFVFDYEIIKKNLWLNKIHWKKSRIIVDPNLKSIGFERIQDAYQCYQSLEQYISGVLGNTEKEDDNRSDKEKVKSHGFDEKYGFRTRKK